MLQDPCVVNLRSRLQWLASCGIPSHWKTCAVSFLVLGINLRITVQAKEFLVQLRFCHVRTTLFVKQFQFPTGLVMSTPLSFMFSFVGDEAVDFFASIGSQPIIGTFKERCVGSGTVTIFLICLAMAVTCPFLCLRLLLLCRFWSVVVEVVRSCPR